MHINQQRARHMRLTATDYLLATSVIGVVLMGFIGVIAWVGTIANVVL